MCVCGGGGAGCGEEVVVVLIPIKNTCINFGVFHDLLLV